MVNFSRFYDGDVSDLATVVAFDPGEKTGWCALGVPPYALDRQGVNLRDEMVCIEYGQISCRDQGGDAWANTVSKHAGLCLAGENAGVSRMLDIVARFGDPAVVFEDFIPDPKKFDQARHTLSPVRITSAFSFGFELQGWNLGQIFVQNRSLAKTTLTDIRLKNLGMYDDKSGPHARDATRHAFYFLRDCRGDRTNRESAAYKRHLAWPKLFHDPLATKKLQEKDSLKVRKPRPPGEIIQRLG